jgi:hypothetical protein
MLRKIALVVAAAGLLATGAARAGAVGVRPARTAVAHEVIPWVAGTITVEGVAQEAPGAAIGTSVITAECSATVYSSGETSYSGSNECTLKDVTTGASYALTTITATKYEVSARGVFTLPTSHNFAICPQALFSLNSGNVVVGPNCARMS